MSDLDTRIRAVIGELLDAAPPPPPFPDLAHPKVARARERHPRGAFIVAIIVASSVAIGLIATTFATRRSSHVAIQPSKQLTVADVTFAIFNRPPNAADAPPRTDPLVSHLPIWIDPSAGSRLAIHTSAHRIYLIKGCNVPPTKHGGRCPTPSVAYCMEVVDYGKGGGGGSMSCGTASNFLEHSASVGSGSGSSYPVATWGVVPDFVSRVTYEGRNIPIIDNAFLMEGVRLDHPLVITTPDGDQTVGPRP